MTYFQVTPEHLKIAQGNVRCGHCRNVFSALGNLSERLPDSNTDESADFDDEDFLTDEELGEFEDFDTNIYDDEDSIFDAFIDEEDDSTSTEPEPDQARPDIAAKPAAVAKPNAPTANSAQGTVPASDEASTSAIKKLASLREGQKAYLEKLQQAMREREQEELERQTRMFATPDKPVAPTTPKTPPPPQTKQAPPTPTQSKASPNPTPKPKLTPAQRLARTQTPTSTTQTAPVQKTTPKQAADASRNQKVQPSKPSPAKSNQFIDARETLMRKPDVPVQSSGDDVDFDTALQDLDELEINDEHADFVASVIKEFEATNIATPTQAAPTQGSAQPASAKPASAKPRTAVPVTPSSEKAASTSPAVNKTPPKAKPSSAKANSARAAATQPQKTTETAKALVEVKTKKKMFGLKKTKQNAKKKLHKKRLKKVAKQPPPQPVIEADIPTLPAILREGLQEEAVQNRMTPSVIAWSVGSMLLMLVFLGQTVYFKHDQLAHIGALRPWVARFCHHFDCEISLQYDASELELLGQDIRSLPGVKNALMMSTTIINKADYRQAYPGLQITFTDMNGQRVAMRRFLPDEYLPGGSDIKRGIPPNTPIQVQLRLMDPGSKAINFEFEFFKTF